MVNSSIFTKTFKKKTKKKTLFKDVLNKKKTLIEKKYVSVFNKLYKINKESCNKKKLSQSVKLYSNLCYYSYIKNKPLKYKKYKLDKEFNTRYYQCYYNNNNCIIVFRGTKVNKRDLQMDYNILINDMKKNKYFEKALNITKKIIEKYKTHKIILTGHSLGGSISLFVMNSMKHKIYRAYVFNPGITILPYKTSILKEYSSNKKNYFMIKLGDVISNGILKHNPHNLTCLDSDVYHNIMELHSIKVFL